MRTHRLRVVFEVLHSSDASSQMDQSSFTLKLEAAINQEEYQLVEMSIQSADQYFVFASVFGKDQHRPQHLVVLVHE